MKIDMHCHSYYSRDGLSSPRKLIKSALKKGLDGIALTDHDTGKGWEDAVKAAKELKASLILGQELKIEKQGKKIGEILAYFLEKEIDPRKKEPIDVVNEIKKQGGLAFISHPYSWLTPFKKLEEYVNIVDGVEVFNPKNQTKETNQKAFDFAQKNKLAMVAGSDAHHHVTVGRAYTMVEGAKNLEEFKKGILEKRNKIEGKELPFFHLIFPVLAVMGLKEKMKK